MDGFRELTSRRVAKFVGARFFSVFDYVRDPLKFQVGRQRCEGRPPAQQRLPGAAGWQGWRAMFGRAAGKERRHAACPRPAHAPCRPSPASLQAALECLSFADYSLAIKVCVRGGLGCRREGW